MSWHWFVSLAGSQIIYLVEFAQNQFHYSGNDINNDTSFQCTCRSDIFYGFYCENKIDLCKNSSICYNSQGFCEMNDTQPVCKCKSEYSGVNCEIMSSYLVFQKSVVWLTTIIAIIILGVFAVIVIFLDFTNCGKKPIKKKHEL